jgi:hypothetical protein
MPSPGRRSRPVAEGGGHTAGHRPRDGALVRFGQWIIGLAVIAASGVATFILLSPGEADRLRHENESLAREKFELERSIRRLTAEDRVAEVHVLEQVRAGEMVDGQPALTDLTTLEFIEMDREGNTLPAKRITVQGRTPRIEALVIVFNPESVAAGDALRGKSLALFRGVYGEHQRPSEAVWLDAPGEIPDVYRVNPQPGEFERKLWARFWDYATDRALADRDGVRLTQGEALFVPMRKGDHWAISLQHSAGLNIRLRRCEPDSTVGRSDLPPA